MTSTNDISSEAALGAAQEVWQRAFDFARAENEADLRRAESRFAEGLRAERGERDRLVLETVQVFKVFTRFCVSTWMIAFG